VSSTADTPEPGRRAIRGIAVMSAAGAFLDGYDLLIINAALLLLVPAFGLSGAQTGLLTSLPFIAMAVGALAAGRIADLVGRRRMFLIDVALFFVLAILQAFVQAEWQLFVMRTLIGFAIGMDMPLGTSMLAEYSPRGRIGRMTATMQTMWVAGGMVAAVVGYLTYQLGGADAWRWMFASAAVPALFVAVLRHRLPETPRWLRQREKPASARISPKRILTDPRFRRPVLFFTVYWTVESFLGGPPFVFTSLIFNKVIHFKGSQALLFTAVLSAIYVAGNVICQYWLLDRWGRKPMAVWICLIAGAASILTGLFAGSLLPLVITFAVFAVMTQLAPLPFWPWSVEQLPTQIRATGQSIGSAGGKLGQFIGLNLFTATSIAALGWTPYFVGVGICFAALGLFAGKFGRESRDADLDRLDDEVATAAPATARNGRN
jgi:putative MFS transporter